MSGLPNGWVQTALGTISNVVRGITFPASAKENSPTNQNVCCLRTSNIQREVEWGDIYFVPRSFVKREEQFVQSGDVLMSMANSYELVGKVAIAKEVKYSAAFGAFLSAIRPTVAAEGKYLFHLLRTAQVQSEVRQGSGQITNIANISVGTLTNIGIPLAPLPEQKRIADKLDSVLARVDACRDRLDRLPALLKRFRQSILAAATSGRLTDDWRSHHRTAGDAQALLSLIQKEKLEKSKEYFFRRQPIVNAFDADEAPFELPSTWVWARSSQLFLKITDGAHNTPKVLTEGRPYLTSKDIATGRLDFNSKQFISEQDHHELYSKCRPELGDMLLLRPDEVLSGILDAPVLEVTHDPLGILLQHRHMSAGCVA